MWREDTVDLREVTLSIAETQEPSGDGSRGEDVDSTADMRRTGEITGISLTKVRCPGRISVLLLSVADWALCASLRIGGLGTQIGRGRRGLSLLRDLGLWRAAELLHSLITELPRTALERSRELRRISGALDGPGQSKFSFVSDERSGEK